MATERPSEWAALLAGGVRLFLIMAIVATAGGAAHGQDTVGTAKAVVTYSMRDPASAQFRNVKLGGRCGGAQYVTGFVNGKNGFGGYGDFTIFMVRVEKRGATLMQAFGQAFASCSEFRAAAICNEGHASGDCAGIP
jgi:hypothetical protein